MRISQYGFVCLFFCETNCNKINSQGHALKKSKSGQKSGRSKGWQVTRLFGRMMKSRCLLKTITIEYKVGKTSQNVDCGSYQTNFFTILHFRFILGVFSGRGRLDPIMHTYIHTYFIWCLIHCTSTILQINLQLENFLILKVN